MTVSDARIARRFGSIKATLTNRGATVADADLLIAATTMERCTFLVTGNVRHFKMIDLGDLEYSDGGSVSETPADQFSTESGVNGALTFSEMARMSPGSMLSRSTKKARRCRSTESNASHPLGSVFMGVLRLIRYAGGHASSWRKAPETICKNGNEHDTDGRGEPTSCSSRDPRRGERLVPRRPWRVGDAGEPHRDQHTHRPGRG